MNIIQINLLPVEFRPKKRLIGFDYRVVLFLAIIVAAGAVGFYNLKISDELKMVESELEIWNKSEAMIQKTINLQNEVNRLREDVARRIGIIKTLTSDSDLRFLMLKHINTILPENLWLMRISELSMNNRVYYDIEGMAYTKQGISTFLANLQKFEQFSNVSLISIRPAPTEVRDAYQYVVQVELKSQIPVEETATAQRSRRGRSQ